MDKVVGTLQQLFQVLCKDQDIVWRRQRPKLRLSKEALSAYDMMKGTWVPITAEEIDRWQTDAGAFHLDLSTHNRVLYLRPLDKDPRFVPVLSLICNLDEARTEAKLRIMFIRSEGGEKKPYGIGLRLELGEGRHSHGHAQFIGSLWGSSAHGTCPLPGECPIELPEKQPALPVTASCPVTLVLCLLLSLYGREYCWKLWTERHVFGLKSYLEDIDSWTQPRSKRRRR